MNLHEAAAIKRFNTRGRGLRGRGRGRGRSTVHFGRRLNKGIKVFATYKRSS